ncbi:unnamed protein product [Euphydryas editha]|uniref:Tc1-like transposase DDE domain-containing protein n=1 Tax=Euphydryas editha TaxID=104508 RepID=A0AAU9TTF4_EUPED|nr:unnamed protein product [Euphydryas editha]
MNYNKFKEWFMTLLANLNEPHVIVMDNASYHSVQIDKPPTTANKKSEILEWLINHNIEADTTMLKLELLRLVNLNKPPAPKYILDELAKSFGHTVLRIPPYHCQYNSIEMIWAQIKGYAARNNTTPPFTANKMMGLLKEACNQVTPENWKSVVERTKRIINQDWDRDVHFDNIQNNEFIINLEDCSSESGTESDGVDLECTSLLSDSD